MAERPAPIVPVPGKPDATPTVADLNRLVADMNNQFDALWAAIAALEAA